MTALTDTDRDNIAEARRIGPLLRASDGNREREAGWLLAELADLAERLDAATGAALKLADRWQSFGDGEDAQSECAAELRETIAATLSGSGPAGEIVAASIEQQSAYRNELRHLPGYMRVGSGDRDRLAGWLLAELADLAERLGTSDEDLHHLMQCPDCRGRGQGCARCGGQGDIAE